MELEQLDDWGERSSVGTPGVPMEEEEEEEEELLTLTPRLQAACDELGVVPAELEYRPHRSFAKPGLARQVVNLWYGFAEARRQDLLEAVEQARRDPRQRWPPPFVAMMNFFKEWQQAIAELQKQVGNSGLPHAQQRGESASAPVSAPNSPGSQRPMRGTSSLGSSLGPSDLRGGGSSLGASDWGRHSRRSPTPLSTRMGSSGQFGGRDAPSAEPNVDVLCELMQQLQGASGGRADDDMARRMEEILIVRRILEMQRRDKNQTTERSVLEMRTKAAKECFHRLLDDDRLKQDNKKLREMRFTLDRLTELGDPVACLPRPASAGSLHEDLKRQLSSCSSTGQGTILEGSRAASMRGWQSIVRQNSVNSKTYTEYKGIQAMRKSLQQKHKLEEHVEVQHSTLQMRAAEDDLRARLRWRSNLDEQSRLESSKRAAEESFQRTREEGVLSRRQQMELLLVLKQELKRLRNVGRLLFHRQEQRRREHLELTKKRQEAELLLGRFA